MQIAIDLTVAIVCCAILYKAVLIFVSWKREMEDEERRYYEEAMKRWK